MQPLLTQGFIGFLATLVLLNILARVAPYIGLVDIPTSRKQHLGEVPLVGGIAIYIALIFGVLLWGSHQPAILATEKSSVLPVFIFSAGLLVLVGAIDDRIKLSVSIRILVEVIVAISVIEGLDVKLQNLGAILGGQQIILPVDLGYVLTVVAIVGIINAFNMLDGIDGLLASLVLVTLVNFHIITSTLPGLISSFIGASVSAFLISNLSLSKYIPRTFLGDAGSRLMGFFVVCLLLTSSSGQIGSVKLIEPITALYITAFPLFDMIFTITRRIRRGKSPFQSDRSHIHHLMKDMGFSDREALAILIIVGSAMPALGLGLYSVGVNEQKQFLLFILCFLFYCLIVANLWGKLKN